MLKPLLRKNDKVANRIIIAVSVIVFVAVTALSRVELKVDLPFAVHTFAGINAWLNTTVSVCLILALWAVKSKKYTAHKNFMMAAIVLSVLFLLS